jgi:hypothetical protein
MRSLVGIAAMVLALSCVVPGSGAVTTRDFQLTAAAPAALPRAGCIVTTSAGFEQLCINVQGTGLRVDRVSGELERPGRMLHYDCDVQINAFGTLATGAPYNQTGTAKCGLNSTWVSFSPRADFRAGSNVCVRARGDGEWTRPACLDVKP